jgi:hypothetical protein
VRLVLGSNPTLKVVFAPEINTRYSFLDDFIELSDGNVKAIDRGAASDIYESLVTIYGTETYVKSITDEIETARQAGTNSFVIDQIIAGQELFGADIDYSSGVTCTIADSMPFQVQGSLKGFGVKLRLRAVSPTFTGSASIPTLYPLVGYTSGVADTLNRYDTYDGTWVYADRRTDAGEFTANYEFDTADMKALRRYIATQRGGDYTISALQGVQYPFGFRTNSAPYTCKIIRFIDRGMIYPGWWRCTMTLREVI